MPPKPQGHNLQNYISKTKRSEHQQTQQHGLNGTQKYRSPVVHETRNNTMSQAGLMLNPHGGSVGMLPPQSSLPRRYNPSCTGRRALPNSLAFLESRGPQSLIPAGGPASLTPHLLLSPLIVMKIYKLQSLPRHRPNDR